MANISSNDTILATVTAGTRQITTLRISGFNSISEIVRHILQSVKSEIGIITLSLRNVDEGWTMRRAVRVAA